MLNYHNSKVTLELGEMVESGVQVWDFDYPSYYKGEEKTAFEQLVLDHYRFRQIGMETPGRWLHSFRTRIREIMPYYIQLYKSVELMANVDDPFKAYDLTETFTKHTTGSGSTTGTSESESTGSSESSSTSNESRSNSKNRKFSNTPQGSIDNIEKYMTEASVESEGDTNELTNTDTDTSSSTASASSSGSSESEGTETYELKRFGNIGVQPLGQEIEAYRKALINVDLMVIDELKDLFLKVY